MYKRASKRMMSMMAWVSGDGSVTRQKYKTDHDRLKTAFRMNIYTL